MCLAEVLFCFCFCILTPTQAPLSVEKCSLVIAWHDEGTQVCRDCRVRGTGIQEEEDSGQQWHRLIQM